MIFSRFRRRRTLIVLAVVVLLGLGHALILQLLAWPLLARESPLSANVYCLHGEELGVDGFEPFEHAAAWHAEAPGRKILLLLPPDTRVVEIGAVRSFERACRSELDKQRIPPSDVVAIRAEARGAWSEAHALAEWLKEHPGSTVRIACSPFTSGRLRYVFDKVLGPVDAERVGLAILPDPKCRIESWWRSQAGVKAFMFGWLDLIYARAKGAAPRPLPARAAAFQDELRKKIGEAPP